MSFSLTSRSAKLLGLVSLVASLTLACRANAEKESPTPYDVVVATVPTPLVVGSEGRVRLTITPQAPWILKMITPIKVTLMPSAALTLGKTELGKEDIEDPNSAAKTLSTTVKAASAGAHKIDAALSFFLCTDEICQRYETERTIPVVAK